MKFSVVIPTLGGDALIRTIELINKGTMVPNEILVCIPKDFSNRMTHLSSIGNVKLLYTDVKGQVRQRVEGFKNSAHEYVIQLDDDIFVHETCFERLIESISSIEGKVAIAPAIIFEPGGQSCYETPHVNSRTMSLVHGKNWFTPGKITRTGLNIGVNAFEASSRYTESEWLPGGCVIHRKENLILFDYFPFKGKAFYEDVIQSIHLRKNGVKLMIDQQAVAGIDPYDPEPHSVWKAVSDFKKYYPYRKHVVDLLGSSMLYLLLDGMYSLVFTTIGVMKNTLSAKLKRKI